MVGSDGGWWLPLLAHRQTILQPVTYIFESEPMTGYYQWVHQPARMIQTHGLTNPETISTLEEHGITHVYIGQQQGRVNYSGPYVLHPDEMINDPHFEVLYLQDRIWIFEFNPAVE